MREAFAAAEYFGFVHGGESLTAPVFWDVLGAIGRARHGRTGRTDLHLLTNGMLLVPETTRRLVDHGVTSVAVSIDGPDVATNDLIRLGARLPTILGNVREAVRLRAQRRADLRLGLSVVVGRTNVGRLSDMGRLALDLGVDWLKIEETAPATPWARHDLLVPRDPQVLQAMEALREALAGEPIVLVDHLDPPRACDCVEPWPEPLRVFREADDFANRACFRPCRMLWEQACLDPDGTVRPVDYGGPGLGSLLDSSLLELWQGPTMQALRAGVLARHGRPPR
jgi:cyclomaltodextrinase / maltogenic alpha-amylase / neopullulanase